MVLGQGAVKIIHFVCFLLPLLFLVICFIRDCCLDHYVDSLYVLKINVLVFIFPYASHLCRCPPSEAPVD